LGVSADGETTQRIWLSASAYYQAPKLARTIADLADSETITAPVATRG
jgi:predicted ATPase with chaperone activity